MRNYWSNNYGAPKASYTKISKELVYAIASVIDFNYSLIMAFSVEEIPILSYGYKKLANISNLSYTANLDLSK